ncbi:MAG TPA: hypothetical protein VGB68_07185 [Pyrinomonadaceae bacterium]|jgi:hypothetical protein
MQEFIIHLPIASYQRKNEKFDNFGEIYLQLGDYFFPSENWTDFGANIVFWWLQEITKIYSNESDTARCKFMDGNYRFDLQITDRPEIWQIYFIKERADDDEIELQTEVNSEQLSREILKAVTKIEDQYREMKNFEAVNRIEEIKEIFILSAKPLNAAFPH